MKKIIATLICALFFLSGTDAHAQLFKRKAKDAKPKEETTVQPQQQAQAPQKELAMLHYMIDERGDTVFVETLPTAYAFEFAGFGIDWSKEPRLVRNFNAVYPYALMARRLVRRVDEQIASGDLDKKMRKKYIDDMQDELLKEFEPVIRKMTISQGQLLCRLVDREIGKSSYQIVKDYKNGLAAGFWQGVARLFKQNLKASYDPNGQDRLTEELVKAWDKGEFDYIYISVFGRYPDRTVIPSKYM